jgi:quercetin dioxygenase-like cupin family protein
MGGAMTATEESAGNGGSRTPGAHRAGPGEFFFDMAALTSILGGPDYSSVFGGAVEGDRMIAALMRMPAGSGSVAHSHPNEQWIFVLEGTLDATVDGRRQLVGPRQAVYIPADVVHFATATSEQDVVFFTVKDASWGLHGIRK